jgi:hydrogenase nickel incorporation protein HypA/HybF
MHELTLTQAIVEQVSERAEGARVLRLILEIGKLSMVLPDAVRFCFELCAEGTPLSGAELEIQEPPGRARCRRCRAELALELPFGQCGCGSFDLELISGGELRIIAMEVSACA